MQRLKKILFLPDYQLIASFDDRTVFYDFKKLFNRLPVFKGLENIFDTGEVIAKGYGISWNDELDISSDEIYNNGVEIDDISNFCPLCSQ